jgi:hypothetical protein
MAINSINVIPKLYSGKILRTLENNLVAKKICPMSPSAEITKMGDTVYFPSLADPTIGTYTGAAFTYEDVDDAKTALLIDQYKYFAFQVDDIDTAQASIDIKGSQAERAAYKLRDTIDAAILARYVDAGTSLIESAVTSATILSSIARIGRALDEKNVMANDRWLVINPIVKERMILAGIKFQIENGGTGMDGGISFCDYLDFKVYVSNNLYKTGTDETQVAYVMGGSTNSIMFAQQIMKTRAMELQTSFKMGVSGLVTYGIKTIKPQELVTNVMTFAAESAI